MRIERPEPQAKPASYYESAHGLSSLRFSFVGTTWGYYGVYITNVFLTVITLGIYSAWAKIRNKRFFYGNSLLKGHAFEFDANPVAILVSRIIIVAVLLAAALSDEFLNLIWLGFGLLSSLLFLLFPFAIVRGRAFNARHTLHRSVRFSYDRVYWPSYLVFFAYYLPAFGMFLALAAIQQGLQDGETAIPQGIYVAAGATAAYLLAAFPAYHCYRHRIMVNQLRFGKLACSYAAGVGAYYRHAGMAVLLGIVLVFAAFVAAFLFQFTAGGAIEEGKLTAFVFGAVLVAPLLVIGIYRSRVLPMFYSSISFSDGSSLQSSATAAGYFFGYALVNFVALAVSVGILLPWVRVRTWRYVADTLTLSLSRETGVVLAGTSRNVSPLAEEFADVSDFDIDFGVI